MYDILQSQGLLEKLLDAARVLSLRLHKRGNDNGTKQKLFKRWKMNSII